MKNKYLIIFIICLLAYFNGYSQKEYSNWYFGKQAGITFNTQSGEPIFLMGNSLIQYEGCATMSDFAGNLILYTNGENVFNAQNDQINNLGDFLKGHQSSTQSAIIVKKPNSSNIYYIFTSDAGEYVDPPNQGINYTVVDMNGMGGRGVVTSLNNPLLAPASEKLTSTPHINGRDIWILAKGYNNNNLYAWLLTENGVSEPIITSLGYAPSSKNETIGYMKVNSKGTQVALVYNEKPFLELLNFDNKTGVFSNLKHIPIDSYYSLYGVEFSPNSSFLYVSNSGSMLDFYTIFQFDVRPTNADSIAQSRVVVNKDNGAVGAIQLGPNNRIYVAVVNKPFLMGILNPDRKCPQCTFNNNAINLQDSLSYMGLPQAVPKFSYIKTIVACEFSSVQLDPEEFLADTSKYEFYYQWTGPKGFTSNIPRPNFNPVTINDTGTYNLFIRYIINQDTFNINFANRIVVSRKNNFSIIGSNILCEGNEKVLQADTSNLNFQYLWSTGARTRTLRVSKPGLYKLFITNVFGCVDSASINITSIPKPKAEIIGPRLLCNNLPITLSSKYQADTLSYLWSTGDTLPNINVNSIGKYKLIVRNDYGCVDSTEIEIIKIDNLKVEISGDSVICNPNPAKLFVKITPYDSTLQYEYLWTDGQTESNILVNKPGVIGLKLTIEGNCVYNDDIMVQKTDPPSLELNLKDTVVACNGDIVDLEVKNPSSDLQYSWSTGDVGTKITPSKTGLYSVFAKNSLGCESEKSVYIIVKDVVLLSIQTYYFTNNCNTDSISLSVYPKNSDFTYTWSNGMIGDSIIVNKAGKYFVIVKDNDGCNISAEVEVNVGYGLNAAIEGKNSACIGDTILLRGVITGAVPTQYEWSTGENTAAIKVTKSGKYSVRIVDDKGCEATKSIDITFIEIPSAELNYKGLINLCEGDSLILQPININSSFSYNWNDGFNKPQRIIKKSGVYKLNVANFNQCFDSASVEIIFHVLPKLEIESDKDPIICDGAELELSVDLIEGITYKWSDGSTANKISVKQAGNYYLLYQNSYGCSDSINFIVKSGTTKEFNIIANKIEFCSGDSVKLFVDEDFSSYKWSNGETTKSIVVYDGGDYSVEVSDEYNCKSNKSISITKYDSNLLIGLVDNNSFESCDNIYQDTITIVNNSDGNYNIDNVVHSNNIEIINKQSIIGIFNAKEQKFLIFRILNSSIGGNNYKFSLTSDKPCISAKEFEINYRMRAETVIKLDTLVLESGAISCIPISYNKICPKDYKINSGFEFTIRIPADYFDPQTLSIGTIVTKKYDDGFWILTIKVDDFTEIENDSLLLKICGTNLIGSNEKKEIQITQFNWEDDNIAVNSQNGLISSVACAIKLRSIQYFRPTSINVTPNPAGEKIELTINTSSIGKHLIKIYNSNGDVIEEKIFNYEENSPYIHKILLNSHKWQNGIYFVVLESPWGVVNSEKIIVVK